jgi:hypothetical protein
MKFYTSHKLKRPSSRKGTKARIDIRCTTHKRIPSYAFPVTGENRRSLLDYSFGPQLRSDFRVQTTSTGLAPSPARSYVQLKRTLSVIAFGILNYK